MKEEPVNEDPARGNPANRKLLTAMVAYAILCGAGGLILDGLVRKAFLMMMLAFVAKTLIAWKAGW